MTHRAFDGQQLRQCVQTQSESGCDATSQSQLYVLKHFSHTDFRHSPLLKFAQVMCRAVLCVRAQMWQNREAGPGELLLTLLRMDDDRSRSSPSEFHPVASRVRPRRIAASSLIKKDPLASRSMPTSVPLSGFTSWGRVWMRASRSSISSITFWLFGLSPSPLSTPPMDSGAPTPMSSTAMLCPRPVFGMDDAVNSDDICIVLHTSRESGSPPSISPLAGICCGTCNGLPAAGVL
mmetsp:Transcript_11737/g.35763  ORF Transcript_11737/g.35763 Transcript_11737/m.35763 type:complete len:235 (-) Transcript_11737:758-1462(-)